MQELIHSILHHEQNQIYWQRILFHAYLITRLGLDPALLPKRVAGKRASVNLRINMLIEDKILNEDFTLITNPTGNAPYNWVEMELSELIGVADSSGSKSLDNIVLHSDVGMKTFGLDEFYRWEFEPQYHHTPQQIIAKDLPSTRRTITSNLKWMLNEGKDKPIYRLFPEPYHGDRRTLLSIMGIDDGWRVLFSATSVVEASINAIFEAIAVADSLKPIVYAPAFNDEAIDVAEEKGVALINLLGYLKLHSLLSQASSKDIKKIRDNFPTIVDEAGLVHIKNGLEKVL